MLKNKKAQGLSLNTIIIAALVIIVLVILIMVFTGRMGWFTKGLFNQTEGKTCASIGGSYCTEDECALQNRHLTPVGDLDPGQVCCKTSCQV